MRACITQVGPGPSQARRALADFFTNAADAIMGGWSGHADAAYANDAAHRLKHALTLLPTDADVWMMYGDVLRWRYDRRAAVKAYDRAVRLSGAHF